MKAYASGSITLDDEACRHVRLFKPDGREVRLVTAIHLDTRQAEVIVPDDRGEPLLRPDRRDAVRATIAVDGYRMTFGGVTVQL